MVFVLSDLPAREANKAGNDALIPFNIELVTSAIEKSANVTGYFICETMTSLSMELRIHSLHFQHMDVLRPEKHELASLCLTGIRITLWEWHAR